MRTDARPEPRVRPATVYSVGEVTELIKGVLDAAFPAVWVEGEISNHKRHTSGHVYFTLKDERAALCAVLFRSEARKVPFELRDGLRVVCRGRISVFEARGIYQLYVDVVEPKGKGALQLAFEQLRDRLKAEGLFEAARKRPLPVRPGTIGIVTSPTGAALRDILRILRRRYAGVRVLIAPAKVQGEGAAEEIAAAVETLGRRADVDVLIVGRGGGSIEDLWAFNDERVARAIFACPVPVISAVGHEIDFTIADFVADVRASTPSAAAELVCRTEAEFRERILGLTVRLGELLRFALRERRARVADLSRHRIFEGFRRRLLTLGQRVDDLDMRAWRVLRDERQRLTETRAAAVVGAERLRNAARARLQELTVAWERLAARLHGLSPLDILKKGYAVCWRDGGLRLIHRIQDVDPGADVIVSFYKGEFRARVESVDPARTVISRFLEEGE